MRDHFREWETSLTFRLSQTLTFGFTHKSVDRITDITHFQAGYVRTYVRMC